jgi:hypothetical protein
VSGLGNYVQSGDRGGCFIFLKKKEAGRFFLKRGKRFAIFIIEKKFRVL